MPAVTVQESIGGHVGIGRGVMPDGTEVEVGTHRVVALGGRNFLSAAWTPYGSHDAEVVRCKRHGDAPPLTWIEKVEIAKRRDKARREKELAKTFGQDTGPVVAQQTAPLTGLAAQLAGFEDDEEMQLLIIKRWNEKRAADKASGKTPAAPATEVEHVAAQTKVTEHPISEMPKAEMPAATSPAPTATNRNRGLPK